MQKITVMSQNSELYELDCWDDSLEIGDYVGADAHGHMRKAKGNDIVVGIVTEIHFKEGCLTVFDEVVIWDTFHHRCL